ncbi:MAG: PQQ-like beta-propeller repeat protein [Verrucomicrobia bacterium]|nr:PQQ-like beta-propeller repeat protein [Verrucomicrobiota bacterium]
MNCLNQKIMALLMVGSVAILAPGFSSAENWPQWRGPFFNGSSTETNLPDRWSETENIVWKVPLPGQSGATPAIWGDSIFVSSPDAQKNLLLICFDRREGKVRWQKQVATGDRKAGNNNMASPSPVTDGQSVFVIFGTGDLTAFDFSGNELWTRNLAREYGRFANMWQYGASPLLFKGRLYIQVLQRSPLPPDYTHAIDDKPERESFILCLDPKTGKNIWRHVRPTDAIGESKEAYTTPIPYEGKHGSEIIILGGDYVTAHDAATGDELWRCGGLNSKKNIWWRTVPSPVAADGFIYVSAPKREPLLAVKDGGAGLVTDTHIAWKLTEYSTDVCTPLYYQNKLFVLDGDRQMMTCLNPKTGEKIWQGNLGLREIIRASPTGADGKIYCISEKGNVVILDAGNEFKILATIPMGGEPCRSSIVAAGGQLFIRTAENLYCLGKK